MMLPTHILMGGSLGLSSMFFFPQHFLVAVLAGMVGGFLPDIDMFWEHRKTCHRPFQFLLATLIFFPVVFLFPIFSTVAVFFLLASVTVHSWVEILSNGKTMRPYQNQDNRAVYDHLGERWFEPRRLVVMGSPRDLVLTLFFGSLLLYHVEKLFYLVVGVVVWGVLYALLSRKVKEIIPDDYDRFSQFFQSRIGLGA